MCQIVARSLIVLLICGSLAEAQDATALLEEHLISGELAAGEAALIARLDQDSGDAQARFGLGVLQVVRGVEALAQVLYRHGVTQHARSLPFLRIPVGQHPNPDPISHDQLRELFLRLATDLTQASATLAMVDDRDVRLPLHFGRIRLDFNGDGQAEQEETLWRLYAATRPDIQVTEEAAREFVIGFDYADVLWLRGYCHLLLSMVETVLAHDWKELFERTGHVLFPKVVSPYTKLLHGNVFRFGDFDVVDLVAFVHLVRFQVVEPQRMQAAHQHLLEVIRLSRQSWNAIEQETDDEAEWIPGPRQTGVLPGVRVGPEMVASWRDFLGEAEALLEGRKLVPHPRFGGQQGINLKRLLLEAPHFDLVLLIQGTGAFPYVEEGEVSSRATWREFQRTFRGQFLGFAFWFN